MIKPRYADRVKPYGTTIFTEMTNLAREHEAVNLGQGFPDFPAPDFIKEAAQLSIAADMNQYAPMTGIPRLRQALAGKIAAQYQIEADPNSEITITHGATEGIFATILGLINPGDEVIVFEPYFDSYVPAITMSGGIPVFYTLRPPDWAIDPDELARLFTDKTKLILINTPHNPIGKVYTIPELRLIAGLCLEHDVIALSDEVYEHIIFDEAEHVSIMSLPGMRERTVMISSFGKTFSVTGWKMGWTVAAPDLTIGIRRTHQFMTFAGNPATQNAAAQAIEEADERNYYQWLQEMYQKKRDYLVEALENAGIPPILPLSTYFIIADISQLGFADDVHFCRHLTETVGVTPIPPSAFYHNPADGAKLARFAFCKSEPVLTEAARRMTG